MVLNIILKIFWPSYTFFGDSENGIAETVTDNQQRWTWENLLTYTTNIDKHGLDFAGLFSRESFSSKNLRQDAWGFVNDDNLHHNDQAADTRQLSSNLTETEIVSFMGRVNYNFDSRYLVTVTVRRDGYYGFGENEKYGNFPSLALAWVPSAERFFPDLDAFDFIDIFKVRASLGRNGNMGIAPYQTLDAFRNIFYVWGGSTANALELNTVGNPFLKWESTTTINTGIDYAIFGDRISGSVDYYQSRSNDLIMSRQLPVMNGYQTILFNVGETENKGFEFNLNTTNVQTSKF